MLLVCAIHLQFIKSGVQMAKPNYSYEKRQKEIARKKKQEEKRTLPSEWIWVTSVIRSAYSTNGSVEGKLVFVTTNSLIK